jgi:hypothetical protein
MLKIELNNNVVETYYKNDSSFVNKMLEDVALKHEPFICGSKIILDLKDFEKLQDLADYALLKQTRNEPTVSLENFLASAN